MSAQFREPMIRDGYGYRRMGKLPPCPPADETNIIARAQSLLTRNGKVGPILPPDKALRVIRAAERGEKPRVTVPQPRADTPVPLPASDSQSLPGCAAQATEYAADECASACSPDYWADAPASYQEIRG